MGGDHLLAIVVDAAAVSLAGITVSTYLEKREDAVTLDVLMRSRPPRQSEFQ